MNSSRKIKVIAVVGPTASGKSDLAVRLAKRFNGEIISADSRQVYKGLDVGTNKITAEEMDGIPHHLVDVVDPSEEFSAHQFRELGREKVREIQNKGKIPIIAGGTGFYIDTLLTNSQLPNVPQNKELRRNLEKKTEKDLHGALRLLDPRRARTIDPHNKVRLIRALEIASALGSVPEVTERSFVYETLIIGLALPKREMKSRIEERVERRIDTMIDEAERLHNNGLSYARMREIGLNYWCLADYLEQGQTRGDLIAKMIDKEWQYAKRQVTWFKRDENILWFHPDEKTRIEKIVSGFLSK